jgi:flagellar biosynthetic protein FliR
VLFAQRSTLNTAVITFTSGQLDAWLVAFIWPFTRILALLAVAPVTGGDQFPARGKVGLAVLMSLVIAPTIPSLPTIDPGSWDGLFMLAHEMVIGLTIGFAMRLVFVAVELAAELIGLQMGLGFAQFYDVSAGGQVSALGRFFGLAATLTFLAINGHLLLFSVLADSFTTMPVAGATGGAFFKTLVSWGGYMIYAALSLALPVIAALLITNLGLGILGRAAPQLNVFAVGFPITLTIGLIAVFVSVPFFLPIFERLVGEVVNMLLQLKP